MSVGPSARAMTFHWYETNFGNRTYLHSVFTCIFMMDTVLLRLQTMKCSGFLGSGWTEFTVISAVDEEPKDLNVVTHSVKKMNNFLMN